MTRTGLIKSLPGRGVRTWTSKIFFWMDGGSTCCATNVWLYLVLLSCCLVCLSQSHFMRHLFSKKIIIFHIFFHNNNHEIIFSLATQKGFLGAVPYQCFLDSIIGLGPFSIVNHSEPKKQLWS